MKRYAPLWVAHAMLYVERFHFSVIPVSWDKRPLIAWRDYQNRRATMREILSWKPENLGIVTGKISGIVVLDFDALTDAVWFEEQHPKLKPAIVETRRGRHLYFRHPGDRVKNAQKVHGRYDIRGDGGFVVAPPSKHSEGVYHWVSPVLQVGKLPVFEAAWAEDDRPRRSEPKDIQDGLAYVRKIFAIEGERGDLTTYRVVCCLRDAGLTELDAVEALINWNETNAKPPWKISDLLRKVRDVYRKDTHA